MFQTSFRECCRIGRVGATFPPPCRPIHDHGDGERSSGLQLLANERDGRFTIRRCARRDDGGANAGASGGDADVVAEGQIIIMVAEGGIKVGRADDAVLALRRPFGRLVWVRPGKYGNRHFRR